LQAFLIPWHRYEMNVILHKTIRQYIDAMLIAVPFQPVQICSPVAIREEDIAATVTALGNVVRYTRKDGSCYARHSCSLALTSEPKKGCVPFLVGTVRARRRSRARGFVALNYCYWQILRLANAIKKEKGPHGAGLELVALK
jgi:hypothetical protein